MSLTLDAVLAAIGEHGTYPKAAKALGITPHSLTNAIYRKGWREQAAEARRLHAASQCSQPTVSLTEGEGPLPLGDLERILAERGLDGSRFICDHLRLGEWEAQLKGGGTGTLHSIRAVVRPTSDLVVRASTANVAPPKLAKPPKKGKHQLVALLSDQHIPFADRDVHGAVLRWCEANQPQRIVLLGDLLDLDMLSRHPWDARWNATMQEAINAGHSYVADLRHVCPDAQIDYLLGNHEDRARQKVIERVREMYGIRRANTDQPVLSLEWLLALDELSVVVHTDEDLRYDHSQLRLAPSLVARHGSTARKGAGASALGELERATHGICIGHTHRQGLVRRTLQNDRGEHIVVWACEVGTLAQVKGGLGYAPRPDWQQGFATATIRHDGSHEVELAAVVDGELRWRGQSW